MQNVNFLLQLRYKTALYAFPSRLSFNSYTPLKHPFNGFADAGLSPPCTWYSSKPRAYYTSSGNAFRSSRDDPTQSIGFSFERFSITLIYKIYYIP